MSSLSKLIFVFEETRRSPERPENDFTWSSWESAKAALDEVDQILSGLSSGVLSEELTMGLLFAPIGPIQEVGLSSGWSGDPVRLSGMFEEAMANET